MKSSMAEILQRAEGFFQKQSPVHRGLQKLVRTLEAMGIDFSIAGALAVNAHGHTRTTAEVKLLLSREDLERFKKTWLGRGWVELFPGSKGFRDTEHDVRIDVLLTGDFPGDGKPKPVAFPAAADASERDADGIPVLTLRDKYLELWQAAQVEGEY